jgi:hypothetical protein
MNAFLLIIPLVFLLVVTRLTIPHYVPAPRQHLNVSEMSPFEYRQRVRAQKYKEAMKVESVTAGDSE